MIWGGVFQGVYGFDMKKRGVNSELSYSNEEKKSKAQVMKTRVIINPKAGYGHQGEIEKILSRYLDPSKFDCEIIYTTGPGHATLLSQQAASKQYDLVIAVGGDGTVNEVGKGLIGTETAMGIIPRGSGNGLARHLKLPSLARKAIEVINDFHTTSIDTIKFNDDYFTGVAGIGFDAHIAQEFSKAKLRGFWSYAALVLKEYPNYKPEIFQMKIDGKPFQKEGLLVTFANSSQYGNDIKIAPQATLTDGYIHLAILKNPAFSDLSSILFKLKNGTIASSKYYESMRCKEIEIPTKGILAHIDGEPIFYEEGLHLKVYPKSLRVVVP